MRCHYHAEEEAIGACATCGHPLCEDCTVERDRVFYCADCLAEKADVGEAEAAGESIPKIKIPFNEYSRPQVQDTETATPGSKGKQPGAATLLSILLPFTGQIYNGQFAKALTFLLLFISCFILASKSHPMEGLFWMIAVFIYFYQIYDAFKTARGIRDTEQVTALVPVTASDDGAGSPGLTGDPESPSATVPTSESPVWGISLILLGIAFLLDNFNLVQIESLARLWPLFVVGTGLLMILTYLRRSTS